LPSAPAITNAAIAKTDIRAILAFSILHLEVHYILVYLIEGLLEIKKLFSKKYTIKK
jgi:hypothetical protein